MTITSTNIAPCLWFDDQLEEAAAFYTSIFPNSSIGHMSRYGSGSERAGSVLAGEFTLDGMRFRAINGGPEFTFSEAVSFSVDCRDQAEVDYYWHSLVDGGEESMCGWLRDRYGLSWQVVPGRAYDLVSDPDPAKAEAAQQALFTMRRIVLADMEAAVAAVGSA